MSSIDLRLHSVRSDRRMITSPGLMFALLRLLSMRALWIARLRTGTSAALRIGMLREAVIAILQPALLTGTRVALLRIAALIARQRCAGRWRASVPAVPIWAIAPPARPPMLCPSRRLIAVPVQEIRWRAPVEAYRNTQNEIRHSLRRHQIPRTVVPSARVPRIVREGPVEAIIEEQVDVEIRGVIDRKSRHRNQIRIRWDTDSDPHARHGDTHTDTHLRESCALHTAKHARGERCTLQDAPEEFRCHGSTPKSKRIAVRSARGGSRTLVRAQRPTAHHASCTFLLSGGKRIRETT